MVKKAQFDDYIGVVPEPGDYMGPTLGSVEHAILMDQRLSALEKRKVIEALARDLGHPSSQARLTPSLLDRLGGGLAGAIMMRLLGSGAGGVALGALAGLIIDYYMRQSPAEPASYYAQYKPSHRIM